MQPRTQEAFYRGLVEELPGMVFRASGPFPRRMDYASPGGETLSGRQEQGDWDGWLLPEDVQGLRRCLESCAEGEDYRVSYRLLRPDGRLLQVLELGRHLGEGLQWAGVVHEMPSLPVEIGLLPEPAEVVSEPVLPSVTADFLTELVREVRAPLEGILGMTRLLLDSSLPHFLRQHARVIDTCSHALESMLDDLRDLVDLETASVHLESGFFDPLQLVEEVLEMNALTAQRKGIELLSCVAAEVPRAMVGDKGRLRQLLLRLLVRAVEASPGGEVSLRLEVLRVAGSWTELSFAVFDTGVGPDAGEGSPGVILARTLAQRLGASLQERSQEPGGSCARLVLSLPRSASPLPREFVPPSECRVLLVLPGESSRRCLQSKLEALGCRVESVERGGAALEKVESWPEDWDLVLVAKDLPDMDGLELGHKLEALVHAPRRLLLLPLKDCLEGKAVRGEGFDGYLTLPVRSSQLAEHLHLAAAPSVSDVPKSAVDLGTERPVVLVAEDNPVNRMFLVEMLERMGYECKVAENGFQAVERLAVESFSLVLMDIQMPEMDGITATRLLRCGSIPTARRDIPVIALTANVSPADLERYRDAGIDGVQPKPVVPEVLEACLRAWFAWRSGDVRDVG